MNNELTPKQQTSEAIRQAETILITTGQRPTVDQVAATLALSAILRKFGKKVSAIISDQLPQSAQFLDTSGLDKNLSGLRDFILKVDVTKSQVESVRYENEGGKLNLYLTPFKGGFAPSDVTFGYGDYHFDIVIVLGVAQRGRIDRVLMDNSGLMSSAPVLNIDFHRTNENYGAVNLIEPTASSLCEILVALSESLQSGLIDSEIATVMLTGLMASTDRFTATHTTSKSLTVAAQLMAAGAKQQQVVRGLYQRGERSGERGGDRSRSDQSRPDQPQREQSRGDQNRGDQNRSERTERSGQPAWQPQSVQSTPTSTERRPEPASVESTRPEVAVSTPVEAERPERVRPEATSAAAPQANPDAQLTDPPESEEVDSLLQPNHIEMSRPEPDSEASEPAVPMAPMADFAAAAEILRQRQEGDARLDADDRPAPSQRSAE